MNPPAPEHTLVTFLGKGRDNRDTGYRRTLYRFPDGTETPTSYFGLALADHLAPHRLVILGTRGSQWGVLVENLATGGEEEDIRLAVMDAEAEGTMDQALLDRVAPLMGRAVGRPVIPRIIPFGRNGAEQNAILQAIADAVPGGQVSFDLTHGFRHLGMVGLLSAFMLERVGRMTVTGLWYGALDMTEADVTPVLRLDGLAAVQRWVDALDRFDAAGDYGVFAPLLMEDGVPADKARCLEDAAFHERTFNLADAARKLRTFLPVLDQPMNGASGLFQERLRERLEWVGEGGLAGHQRALARQYLARADFVRAAILGWEAVVSRECDQRGLDPHDFKGGREVAAEELEAEFQADEHPAPRRNAYWTLKNLRNALAHGNPPRAERYRRLLKEAAGLHTALDGSLRELLG